MKKLCAFVFSLTTFLLVAAPAYAGRLLSWRFDANQNRLIFVTEESVKPVAQLIPNPTRLVIDLPGTILGRPKIEQSLGSVITTLRIGQFDPNTTRLVIELAPGYILDPRQIKIRGISPTQWLVELPQPQPGEFPIPSPSPNPQPPNPTPQPPTGNPYFPNPNPSSSPSSSSIPGSSRSASPASRNNTSPIRVTSSGLLIALGGSQRNRITVQRSDRRRLYFEVEGLKVAPNLLQSWPVNKYGVGELEISEKNNTTVITLHIHPDSPDWQASFTTRGELLIWPQGGMTQVMDLPVAPFSPSSQSPSTGRGTLIESIEVTNNQLSIRANLPIRARGSWINENRIYEIRLENASLAPNFQEPILMAGSPISRLRILQPKSNSLIIQVEPAQGVRIGEINQLSEEFISLPLTVISPFNPLIPPANALNNPYFSPITTLPSSVNPYDYTPSDSSSPSNNNRPLNPNNPPRSQPNNRNPSRGRILVVIDPGHGGKDVGAVGVGGIFEKDIVLSISLQVARLLEQQGVQVRLTRGGDYFISLQERSEMANRLNADIFVSIHANSAGANKPNVNGYETYYYTPQSRALAESIHRNIIRRVNVVDRGVRTARFYVIRTARMPSVLLETGFVTGMEDAAKLTNPTFQRQMAEAIAAGIIEYIKTRQ
ncbi:MAG TPA: N-acetylmuramoyl-L-alanine amidase [Geminocystis sp. M7585_C2015_104]|nr:N-acetylmuramoyl-L-alanine amidase [Geminocystis sp. M7585_C2015_104]